MNTTINHIKRFFVSGTAVMQLIYINVALFVLLKMVALILKLFLIPTGALTLCFALPSSFWGLLYHPWAIITYMFYHESFSHILFNMVALYWFGKIAIEHNYSSRQIYTLYFCGGIAGGLLYLLAYACFPYFRFLDTFLLGASGAITAICVSVATSHPWYQIRLFLIGNIKLVWVAIMMVMVSFFGITGNNAGGEICHIGGALLGFLFGWQWRKGRDLSNVGALFKKKKKSTQSTTHFHYQPNRAAHDTHDVDDAQIDEILDKIRQFGYASLTSEEKNILFTRQGNKS